MNEKPEVMQDRTRLDGGSVCANYAIAVPDETMPCWLTPMTRIDDRDPFAKDITAANRIACQPFGLDKISGPRIASVSAVGSPAGTFISVYYERKFTPGSDIYSRFFHGRQQTVRYLTDGL